LVITSRVDFIHDRERRNFANTKNMAKKPNRTSKIGFRSELVCLHPRGLETRLLIYNIFIS